MADNAQNKTQIFNLVILDKSGSMSSIRDATINGLNETINGIRQAQLKHIDTQEHYFTLHTFCSCEQKQVYDGAPIAQVSDITSADYVPCCCTPLFDAVGIALNRMKEHTAKLDNYAVVVTIITDGYENASKEYTGKQVAEMIEQLRKEGWAVAYMGADHDVETVARRMNIVNTFSFEHTDEGTGASMEHDLKCRMAYFDNVESFCAPTLSRQERISRLKKLSDSLYGKDK